MSPLFPFRVGASRRVSAWMLALALLVSGDVRAGELDAPVALMGQKKFVRARGEMLRYASQFENNPTFNYWMGVSYLGSATEEVESKRASEAEVVADLKSAQGYLLKARQLNTDDGLRLPSSRNSRQSRLNCGNAV